MTHDRLANGELDRRRRAIMDQVHQSRRTAVAVTGPDLVGVIAVASAALGRLLPPDAPSRAG